MLIPVEFIRKKRGFLDPANYEDSLEHDEFTERLRKSLYYGKTPTTDRPSMPVTELAVGFFRDAAPRELGRVDLTLASDVSRQACISPCSMMLGMIYVDRLKHRNPEYLQQVSSSDLFLISMMMASKYLYDEGVDEEVFNDEWAESADMDVEDVNTLERTFLKAIDWELYVRQTEFFDLLDRIERKVARDKSRERGFYTYTDLMVLACDDRVHQAVCAILREVCKVVVVCSVAYVAGLLTMVGSTMTLIYVQQSLPVQPVTSGHYVVPAMGSLKHEAIPQPGGVGLKQRVSETAPWALDGNGSSDRQDNPWAGEIDTSTDKDSQKATSPLSMSGILTLAFIKDAVSRFVIGLNNAQDSPHAELFGPQAADLANMISVNDKKDNIVCTCGCCVGPVNHMRHCVNVSLGDTGESSFMSWTGNMYTMKPWAHQDLETSENGHCEMEAGTQCCCRSHSQWRTQEMRKLGKSQVERPFHNVLGFWTTAEALTT